MPGGAEAGLRRAIKGEERSGIMKRLFDAVFRPHYYAGARAEEIFEQQAEAARWIMERISQEKKTIMKYKDVARSSVKRGDFICRNCCNAEIEVKCKTKTECCGLAGSTGQLMGKYMKTLAVTLMAAGIVTLGGCTPGVYWTKPGFTEAQFKQDTALCEYEAVLTAERELEEICYETFSETYTRDSAFKKCTALITSYDVEREYPAEGMMKLYMLCMKGKGYVEMAWP